MSGSLRFTTGGKAVSGGALSPRTSRGSTAQAVAYWSGGGESFMVATGGTINTYTESGILYKSHTFTGSSSFVISDLGSYPTIDYVVVGGAGGGGAGGGGRGPLGLGRASHAFRDGGTSCTSGGGGNGGGRNGGGASAGTGAAE